MISGKSRKKANIDPWGVHEGYRDYAGRWKTANRKTVTAIHAAMKMPSKKSDKKHEKPVRVVKAGRTAGIRGCVELILEDGTVLKLKGQLPVDLPCGYHHLYRSDQKIPQMVIVAPSEGCYLPDGLNGWGWSMQLYALRSARSWGIGDLADLEQFVRWSASKTTADMLLINPLCAPAPGLPQQPSPYYPTSRLFRNPLYLNIETIPGAAEDLKAIERIAAVARQLNDVRHIDRDAVFGIKMTALERLWKKFRSTRNFERYCNDQGEALEKYAVFCVLSERYGPDWRAWPQRFRKPDNAAVKRFATDSAQRVSFHQWLQWLIDRQLKRAAKPTLLITDLPVGFDPGGADAWRWQDTLAEGIHVGAPPDQFSMSGQDWGIAPFIPQRLRAKRYIPLIESLKAAMRHAGGLRIDHVMAFFRLFWIPGGVTPQKGAYVAYPDEEMLAVMAVESQRHKAFIIGEDLGTVAAGMRRRLAWWGVLGCAVLWFEKTRPVRYRTHSLASITTHDLPTIAGLWSGQDVRIQRELGLDPPEEDYNRIRRRLCKMTGVPLKADADEVIPMVHNELAQGASMLALATIDDALGVAERPNMPGTTADYPSWSMALPVLLEDIPKHPLTAAVAKAMHDGRRNRHKPG